jgi:SAM-dependent methyltransferase
VSQKVDLYDSAYGNYESDGYRLVRIETYGEDFGQTSWVTTEESNEIPQLLDLRLNSSVLEIGCGSGGYALHLAEKVGCRLVGLDINAAGIRNANQLALAGGLASRAHFEQCDVSKNLPFDDETFDAVFSNDVLCHLFQVVEHHLRALDGRHVVQSAADSVLCQIWHNPEPSEKRGRVLLKVCGDELLSHIVPLEIDWHENKPWRKCDLRFKQALAFPCLRRGVVHLIDTDLSCAKGIPESESVEASAKDDDLPNPSFDSF